MNIGIIGAGRVGSALARAWSKAGHRIVFGVRRPDDADRALADGIGAGILPPAEAAASAEVVVLAVPWSAALEVAASLGHLGGRILIDCTNPLGQIEGRLGLLFGHATSAAEKLAAALPGARVVKTLNQVGAEIMADTTVLPHRPAMFMAGDDTDAKQVVSRLLDAIGFDPLDAGPLVQARLLEPLAMVWIDQAFFRGKGRNWALAAVSARKEID
jgi:8-hydroxy-5-deazaflavin:NADPH oxidoreductase